MAEKNSWSNTESLFRFLEKRNAKGKRVKICYDKGTQTILVNTEGVITFFSPAYLRLKELPLEMIYLDDIKRIEILS